ncbi:hypothetical protein ACJMK2_017339 [Sinanodonta woodiana]|uniref:Uncharacterized protein n=1 Tax=Sinanodonta woodiana TaxID=1069815 RepID=A0ABD3UZ86_SINWO
MEKQEMPCKLNSTKSLDIATTEVDSIFTQVLHDNKVDLEYQKSRLDFMSSSEADILGKKEAVRNVRMARRLQCHIVNNIATACQFPYIEDNLSHTVKAVLQGPTSCYSCSDVESLVYQSVSSSLHGSQSDGKQFMKKVRVNMTSIQSVSFENILVDLHLCSHIVCGESDVQADSTVDDADCEGYGIDLGNRKMRSEEDPQQEERDVHRITDRHHSFLGKVQDAFGEDSERNIASFFLQNKAMLSNEDINTPCEIISTDSKHNLPLTDRENASKLTGESNKHNKGSAEPNGISPIVDSGDTLQRSNNELAVHSDQSLGNDEWLELKAEAKTVHEHLFEQDDLASSHSSLFQAAHFHKPLDVNYAPLQQQQQAEVVSSIESRGQHDQICDKSMVGSSVSTSPVSQVNSEAQSEYCPLSSSEQIKTVLQTESCLPSLAVTTTSSHTPSITTPAKQFDIGSQVNKSESLTINTLSQGNLVSLSKENENKVMNSNKSLTVRVSMNSSAADASAEIGASLQSLEDDRCKASSHEQVIDINFSRVAQDLTELLQNLTSKTYKQSSKSPRVANSWNRQTSQPARFSSFKFCRSDVLLSLPRSGSPSCSDDLLNSLTPDMIPNFEERHRTAELLEEHFASRNEETYNKEECTYLREKHDIPDDLLPAHYPVFEKSRMLVVMTDDTEQSFIQDQTDLLIPGSRTTTFSRTLLSDLSVEDGDKIEVDPRETDIYPTIAEDMNDSKDKTSPKKRATQMQNKNNKKNTTFQRRSLVKSPGLDSKIAMDCFPNVTSPPIRSAHGYLHQHASKTDLDSSLVNEGTPCISQCNNPADYKKSEELLSRQQISKNCFDNVNINKHGYSKKLIMENGDFVNSITALIDGKQIHSTFSENETHQTQTPLQCYQRNYKETKSHGCLDVLQDLTQIECQNSVSQEFIDNNPKRSCIHEKRDEAADGSGMQQQNQVLVTANIDSNRDSLSKMAAKSAQGRVHENEIEHSNTAEKYNSKSHHSYVGITLTNRNIFSLFETIFFKNEDDSAIANTFDFSSPLVDSKQNSLELETVTRNEEPKFPINHSLQSSILENKLILSAADAPSIKFDLNSNMPRSLIAKHDVEAEKSIGTHIVSRNSEFMIPEVDAITNNDINQCQISDFGQDVNGEICSHVKRQQVHCSFKQSNCERLPERIQQKC